MIVPDLVLTIDRQRTVKLDDVRIVVANSLPAVAADKDVLRHMISRWRRWALKVTRIPMARNSAGWFRAKSIGKAACSENRTDSALEANTKWSWLPATDDAPNTMQRSSSGR
jgi:hypothetical protein